MDILGIGPMELLFIVLIALIVLGPKDMIKAGKTIGRALRSVVTSDTWRVVNQASREIRNLPNRLIRESGIDELQNQLPSQRELSEQLGMDKLNQSLQEVSQAAQPPAVDLSPWTSPGSSQPSGVPPALPAAATDSPPDNPPDNPPQTIAPPGMGDSKTTALPQAPADGDTLQAPEDDRTQESGAS